MRGLFPDVQELRATKTPSPTTGQSVPSENALRSKLSERASIKALSILFRLLRATRTYVCAG